MEKPTTADSNEEVLRLTEGLSLSDLISKDGTTFEINFDDVKIDEEQYIYDSVDVFEHANPECLGLVDEDIYDDSEPFESLARKMVDVLEGGKIKKRVIREGYSEKLPPKSVVTVDYNAYLEYNDEPFDSTYLRKRSFTFRLDDGQVLPGLDLAVQTMKLNEKAQFLVHSDYAYGQIGCPPRVPADSAVLYEVEVKNCVDSGACVSYPALDEERQKDFTEIYKYAHALASKGKDLYGKGLIKQAIREYNIAVSKLENCKLRDYEDQEKQQTLLFRLGSNLIVAHTKIQEPRRACTNYNKIWHMCKGTDLKISAKIYFNHARSLIQLSDYDMAERQLKKAHKLEPQNREIIKEFKTLDAKRKESYDRERALAKAVFGYTKQTSPTEVNNKRFQDSISEYCKELIDDKESTQYNLPEQLTKKELELIEKETARHGLELKCSKVVDNTERYFIAKSFDVGQNI